MTAAQIADKQVNDEIQKFMDKVYDGKLNVPANIIELFKRAVMVVPPNFHQVYFSKIKLIASREPNELSNGEISDVVKLILSATPQSLYDDFEEAIATHCKTEKFIRAFNEHVEDFMRKMKLKRTTLMDLSGANGGHMNGMRRIS